MSDDRNIREEIRNGQPVVVLRKKWPDRTEIRREMPSRREAKKLRAQIDLAIANHCWRELRDELNGVTPERTDYTLGEFAEVYWKEYCLGPDIGRPEFHRTHLNVIQRLAGNRKLSDMANLRAVKQFQTDRWDSGRVKESTVNRTMSVLSGLLGWAHKVHKLIDENPMEGHKWLPEDEKKLRIPSADEVDRLIEEMLKIHPLFGAYLGFLSETALREEEGLLLPHSALDLRTVPGWLGLEKTKTHKAREVPISAKAREWLSRVERIVGSPYVFTRPKTRDPIPQTTLFDAFKRARFRADLEWVWIHDLRHYRCTTWLEEGAPVHYVQKWMGHSKIETTMRYAHYSKTTASRIFLEVSQAEENRRRVRVATNAENGGHGGGSGGGEPVVVRG